MSDQCNHRQALLAGELAEYCRSDSLSEVGAREKLLDLLINKRVRLDDVEHFEVLLHEVCDNERVTAGIVRCVLDCVPGSSLDVDEDGNTPLHYVLWNKNVTVNIVQILIDACPESIAHQDNDGLTPLHRLCGNYHLDDTIALGILKLLLEMHPHSACHVDGVQNLPIHLASECQSSDFCRMLIGAFPGSERILDAAGMLPLHIACSGGSVATAQYYLNLHPEGMHVLSTHGYPINCTISGLCEREVDIDTAFEMVEFLVTRDPNVASKEYQGRSPIESAFLQEYDDSNLHVGLKVIQLLYDAYPETTTDCDPLLLHEIFSNEMICEGIIERLLVYFPTAAGATDEEGRHPLHLACVHGTVTPNIVELLIDASPESVDCKSNDGRTALHYLCSNGNVDEAVSQEILALLLQKCPELAGRADEDGNFPIHLASETRSAEFCRLLIESYPGSEQIADIHGMLPLHVACTHGSLATVKCLIDFFPGGMAVLSSTYGYPIDCAVAGLCGRESDSNTAVDIVALLLSKDPTAVSREIDSLPLPFEIAFEQEYDDSSIDAGLEVIQLLYDAHPQATEECNPLLLHELCKKENVAEGLVRCLLDLDPGAAFRTDHRGQFPLHIACENKKIALSIVQLLVDAAPDVALEVNEYGQTPLHILCDNYELDDTISLDILKVFLEKFPRSARLVDSDGCLPIHLACAWESKCSDVCRMLVGAYPGSERITNTDGMLPLHIACADGSVATAEYLLKLHPDGINMGCRDLSYPIHYAIGRLSMADESQTVVVKMVDLLLSCNPNVALQKVRGKLPLILACQQTYFWNQRAGLKVVQLLYDTYPEAIIKTTAVEDMLGDISSIAEDFLRKQLTYAHQTTNVQLLTRPNANGRLPLHIALHKNAALGSIKLLVNGNPSAIQTPDNRGVIPLHVACEDHKSPSVVQYLLGLDTATLDTVDMEGNSALHYACCGAKYDTIALLIEQYHAASASKRNARNQLPIDVLLDNCNLSWDRLCSLDRESIGYTQSVFLLLRANPEAMMNCV